MSSNLKEQAVGKIRFKDFQDKIVSADEAASWIENGMTLGMSGFTLFGEPKVFPSALAKHASANNIKVNVYTGASMGPDADGVLAEHKAINLRLPYQGNPTLRKEINTGDGIETIMDLINKLIRVKLSISINIYLIQLSNCVKAFWVKLIMQSSKQLQLLKMDKSFQQVRLVTHQFLLKKQNMSSLN